MPTEVGGPLEVRPVAAGDADRLGDFLESVARDPVAAEFFWPHPLTRAHAAELCGSLAGKRDRYYVFCHAGRVAAYSMLRGWDQGYAVPSLGICAHPGLRGAGLGAATFVHAIAESRALGAEQLRFTVDPRNLPVIALGRKFGFVLAPGGNGRLAAVLDLRRAPAVEARVDVSRLRQWAAA